MKVTKQNITSFVFLLSLIHSITLLANDSSITTNFPENTDNRIWSSGSAFTIPPGRYEIGIFQPLQYGFNESTELYGFPLLFFIMPNFGIKKKWPEINGINLTTMHSVSCPTFLLRTIARKGTGGILPKEAVVPFILSFENHVLSTFVINDYLLVTPKLGISFSFVSGKADFPTIDYHLVYPRTADYHKNPTIHFGLDLQGNIIKNFDYYLDGDVFLLAFDEGNFTFEHKLMIIWKKNDGINILAGYKYSIGKFPYTVNKKLYPSGFDWKFFPLIDIQWGFKI